MPNAATSADSKRRLAFPYRLRVLPLSFSSAGPKQPMNDDGDNHDDDQKETDSHRFFTCFPRRYNQPFARATRAASTRFLAPTLLIASER